MKIVNSIEELMDALGIKKGDTVNIMTPQFEREYDLEINFTPQDKDELMALIETAPKDVLKKMGVGIWNSYESQVKEKEVPTLKKGEIHYLFPAEWYDHIPNGFEVVTICGDKEKFVYGQSDDDKRFGCLPYGFVRSF